MKVMTVTEVMTCDVSSVAMFLQTAGFTGVEKYHLLTDRVS